MELLARSAVEAAVLRFAMATRVLSAFLFRFLLWRWRVGERLIGEHMAGKAVCLSLILFDAPSGVCTKREGLMENGLCCR